VIRDYAATCNIRADLIFVACEDETIADMNNLGFEPAGSYLWDSNTLIRMYPTTELSKHGRKSCDKNISCVGNSNTGGQNDRMMNPRF
jgi:hypothetical protein